jgi:hypothetical protein
MLVYDTETEGDGAYANELTVLADGLAVVILRTTGDKRLYVLSSGGEGGTSVGWGLGFEPTVAQSRSLKDLAT